MPAPWGQGGCEEKGSHTPVDELGPVHLHPQFGSHVPEKGPKLKPFLSWALKARHATVQPSHSSWPVCGVCRSLLGVGMTIKAGLGYLECPPEKLSLPSHKHQSSQFFTRFISVKKKQTFHSPKPCLRLRTHM